MKTSDIKVQILSQQHREPLLKFELENKAFFEEFIAPRESSIFHPDGMRQHIRHLTQLKNAGSAKAFILLLGDEVIARANLKSIKIKVSAELGYRVAQKLTGKGLGSICVKHLVKVSRQIYLKELLANVMANNPQSESILKKEHVCKNVYGYQRV